MLGFQLAQLRREHIAKKKKKKTDPKTLAQKLPMQKGKIAKTIG